MKRTMEYFSKKVTVPLSTRLFWETFFFFKIEKLSSPVSYILNVCFLSQTVNEPQNVEAPSVRRIL